MAQPKAIIFDMDGLLVDSEKVWFIAEDELIKSRGHQYTNEVRQLITGLRIDEFMVILHDHYQFTESVEELMEELIERVLKLMDQMNAQPGAKEIIDYVAKNNIPHAIASSSPMAVINATLASQGWENLFKVRCSADDDAKGKPAPDVYLRAAKEIGFSPDHCIALEDSPNGARAAVAAGMTCFAIPDPFHSKPAAFNNITNHVFTNLHDVLKHFQTQ